MRRTAIPELLDSDSGSLAEIAGSLADLRMVNRWFGGAATMRDLVREVARRTGANDLSLLDVGSASGDIPAHVTRELAREHIRVRQVLLERSPSHLDGSSAAVVADAQSLPFRDGSFDVIGSSLFAHHLEPGELVRFVNECLRVCRMAVLINDLRRSAAHLTLVYAGFALYRSRLTRHDAPASVRRAYTLDEMRDLLRQTAAASIEIQKHYLCRMGVIAWKSAVIPRAQA